MHDTIKRLEISELPVECPGLISPDVLAEWDAVLNFANRTMLIGGGTEQTLQSSRSGHPVVGLTDFPPVQEIHIATDGGKNKEPLSNTESEALSSDDGSSTSDSSDHAWTSSEEEAFYDVDETFYDMEETFHDATEKIMSKGRRRHVKSGLKEIGQCMVWIRSPRKSLQRP